MTDEWLEWRKAGLGASDVAGVLGLSPWASPWSVWASKVGLADGPDESEAMEFGKRAEPMLAGYFTDRTGLHVAGEQTWCSNPDEPWMRCTVDGFVFDGDPCDAECAACMDEALGVFEAKTTSQAPWEDVPLHYQCQATWASIVTGFDRVWFGVLHLAFGRPAFRVYEFTPPLEDKSTVRAACEAFWRDHVLTGTAPPADGSPATTDALSAAWGETTDEPVDLDDRIVARLLPERERIRAEIKRLEEDKNEIENKVKAALADHESGSVDGWRVSWKPQTRKTVDTKALAAELPEVAEKFARESTSRVLRITAPKGET